MITHNKKGMTLIEIIVVLLISSIAMVIAGSIILNSMQYFEKTASTDRDKIVADGIANFVRDELMYASDVRIVTKEQAIKLGINTDEWHRFSISENKYLEHDEKLAFTEDYYNNKKLVMKVKGIDNDFHIDLDFSLTDVKGEQIYRTKFTLDLINVKSAMSKDNDFNPFSGLKDAVNLTDYTNGNVKYFIYYKIGEVPIREKDGNTGTVEDALLCNTGEGKSFNENTEFAAGDFVYTMNSKGEKDWYQCIKKEIKKGDHTSITEIPGFRRVSKDWTNYSAYIKDDVVIGIDGYYYRCKENIAGGIDYASKGEKPGVGSSSIWETKWQRLESSADVNKDKDYCSIPDSDDERKVTGTVADKLLNVEIDRIAEYDNNKSYPAVPKKEDGTYKAGEFVKVGNDYYLCTWAYNVGAAGNPGEESSKQHWQKVQIDWDENSSYQLMDVIRFENGKYYRSTADVNVNKPNPSSPFTSSWEEVERSADNKSWKFVCSISCSEN